MKVLVLFPDSISQPIGGLGIQFKHIYEQLKDKIDFYVVGYPDNNPGIKNYREAKNPILEVQHGTIITLLGHSIYFAEALKFPKPDIIHAYDWTTYYAGLLLSQHYNIPLLLTMQLSSNALATVGIYNCNDINTIDGYYLHKAHIETEWLTLQKADKIISVSNGYNKYFPSLKDKTVTIPNGINLNEWIPNKKIIFPGDSNNIKVVYIGRFASMKGIDLILSAEIPKGIDIIFIGSSDGGDKHIIQSIEDKINNHPNFHYIGPAYGQDKINKLCSADAVIIPSYHEPFGIVGLESLASKCITISSRVDGLGDYLNDSNSLHCGNTSIGITNSLKTLKLLSQEHKEKLIFNGLETCKNYSWDEIADKYYNEYISLF